MAAMTASPQSRSCADSRSGSGKRSSVPAVVPLLGLLLLCGLPVSAGPVYSWKDADGNVHYSDVPPQAAGGGEVKEIPVDIPQDPQRPQGLRPGEREMLKSYEERSRRLEQAKDRARREAKREAAEKASKENQRLRCDYYRKRQENYEDRLRGGYTREQQLKLEENLARAKMQTGIYCR